MTTIERCYLIKSLADDLRPGCTASDQQAEGIVATMHLLLPDEPLLQDHVRDMIKHMRAVEELRTILFWRLHSLSNEIARKALSE